MKVQPTIPTIPPTPLSTNPDVGSRTTPARPIDPVLTAAAEDRSFARSLTGLWPIAVAFLAFGAVWKVVAIIAGFAFILPPPEVVAGRFVEAWLDGTIAPHAWTTI
ncbi:MAG: hypothetical protein ABIZ72_00660, partial [Candidatus Limnocylindrales bacterium]